MLRFVAFSLLLFTISNSYAQMNFKGQILFGNEWIQPGQSYWKFKVSTDGVFKIDYTTLIQAGFPVQSVPAIQIRLFALGRELPIIRTTSGLMASGDFLLFYGEKNKAALDEALFDDPALIMNPEYSMFNDTLTYYITWNQNPSGEDITRIANDLSAPLPKDLYFIQNDKLVFSEISFKRGTGFGSDQKFPLFDAGQGYSTDIFRNRSFTLNMPHVYTDGPDATATVRITGFGDDNTAHRANFYVDGVSQVSELFAGYKLRNTQITFPAFELKEQYELKIAGEASPEDKLAISRIELNYPQQFKFDQKKNAWIRLKKSVIRKYLELEDFDGGSEIVVYDMTNRIYLHSAREANGIYRITIPPSSEDRTLLVWNHSEEQAIQSLQSVSFKTFSPGQHNYVMLYHRALDEPLNGTNYVQEYANYRRSQEGGSYDVITVDIEDLYDQFAYGIHTHSLAVKNFAQYAKTIWPEMKYFLIIGKGLEYPYYRKSGFNAELFFVPTFCSPASDISLVTDRDKKPLCSFGRIPAINGAEIKSYLDKVKSHESFLKNTLYSLENREWLKRVIHLSGGDPQIYTLISSQLSGMENVIESGGTGVDVKTFYKQSSSSIEIANSELLRKYINEGSAIISFMGHSAAVRLDFNLENVDSYKNKDRYHLFIAMGCYAGSLFGANRSISEDHNLAPEKGSIVYLANTTAGFPDILGLFGNELYRQFGGTSFGKSIGDAVRETIMQMIRNGGERLLTQAYSTTFNGDPAIHINFNTQQDYTIDPSSVIADPSLIFSTQKDFKLNFDIVNLGAYVQDSIQLTVEREKPNGSKSIVFDGRVATPSWRSSQQILIPILGDDAIGSNVLYISLDAKNAITEGPMPEAEQNNQLEINGGKGFKFLVFGNEARPVFPEDFAIVNVENPTLIACNGNTLAPKIRYHLQMDTTEYFNSPLFLSTSIEQTGGIIQWQPNVRLLGNTVYYWRVSPDSTIAGQYAWRNSSFIYIPGSSPGWNQSHFFQYKKDDFVKFQLEEPHREFTYAKGFIEFRANNGYIELPTYIRPRLYVGTDVASDYDYWNYNNDFSGVVVNVFNPITGKLWVNQSGGDFNSYNDPRYAGKPFFVFQTETSEQRSHLMNFLETSIPNDHVVVFSTMTQYQNSYFPELWESDGVRNLYSILESYGAKQVRNLKSFTSVPYILVYRKGQLSFEVKESIGNFTDENEISHVFTIPLTEGILQSQIIGPVSSWQNFTWDHHGENPAEDKHAVNVYGLKTDGSQSLLFSALSSKSQDLSGLSAKEFPRLKLEWTSKDSISRNSAQMDYWRVNRRSLPDAAFHPALLFKKVKDTINQGDLFEVEILAQNIGEVNMDSLLVKFTLINKANQQITSFKRFMPLASLATLKIPYSYKTSSVYGQFTLFIELNPNNDQAELHQFNNTAAIPFYIRRDRRKPFIDVTFNKEKIFNLDIVSSKSVIEIVIQDENKDLLPKDTTAFELRIKEPGGSPVRVYFAQNNVEFIPASSSDNKVKAIIHGDFRRDGIYTLFVKAYDASGNAANDLEYLIDFTIVSKSSVSNLFNYPNPFTTRTKFVYTLTGETLPEYYSIQIMTVSGKVVREIDKDEIGPLQVGTHMTEFEYDGTDQFGERLANGVYLYRFKVKDLNRKDFDKYNNGTDEYFKNELGKMVILR